MLIFLHIPKAAGQTLRNILRREYLFTSLFNSIFLKNKIIFLPVDTPKFISSGISKEPIKHLESLNNKEKKNVKVLTGHFCYGVHKYFNKKAKYITILRNPIDRIISLYYYILRTKEHHLHDYLVDEKISLRDFVRNGITTEVDNVQTRLLAGMHSHDVGFGQVKKEMLEDAKRNLKTEFEVVGISEEFIRSFVLMREKLKWNTFLFLNRNVSPKQTIKDDISIETINLIKKSNKYDIELYEFGKSLFIQQQNTIKNFDKKVVHIEKLNSFFLNIIVPLIFPLIKCLENILKKTIYNKKKNHPL